MDETQSYVHSPVEILPLDPVKEKMLIEQAQQGDIAAFELLIAQHQKRVYNLAWRLTNDKYQAQDIAQEALVRVFRSIKNFRGDSSFSSWLYRIVHNAFLDDLKKSQRKYDAKHVSLDDQEGFVNATRADTQVDISEEQILKNVVGQALAKLPLKLRISLLLYELQGFSYEEISEIEGASLPAIRSRIAKARKVLSQDQALQEIWLNKA